MSGESAMAWTILTPLAGALLARMLTHRVAAITLATILVTLGASMLTAWHVWQHGTRRLAAGGWPAPLGIQLRADGLAALMLGTVGVISGMVLLHAVLELSRRDASRLLPLWLLGWAALDALLLSADAFNLYVTLELTTLVSVVMIALRERASAYSAALGYLLFGLAGSLAYLVGVSLLYGAWSSLDLAQLGATAQSQPITEVALAFMTLGLCLKSGLFPLHAWLPPAYSSSESHVSALLAGLVGKGALYVLLRLWLEAFPDTSSSLAAALLGGLGVVAVLWGSLQALQQTRLTCLLAYSSLGQIGYLFLIFPLARERGWVGGVFLIASHAAAKAALFLAAGTIRRATGSEDIASIGGLAHRLPLTLFAMALSSLTLVGLPPSGGFVAKWLLVRASIAQGQWVYAAALLAGSFLTAAYLLRILRDAFVSRSGPSAELHPPARGAELTTLCLALLPILLGIAPSAPHALLEIGALP